MSAALKDALRRALYVGGLLGAVHRWRNRRTLTVFMFHRVLPQDSVAYANAEREFTFSVDGFARCVDFIKRHYVPISLAELAEVVAGRSKLPSRAALITFDDGWRDTLEYAAPILRQRGLPSLLFVASEAVTLEAERWWQDGLVSVLADDTRWPELARALGLDLPADGQRTAAFNRRMAGALAALPDGERQALLDRFSCPEPEQRQMLKRDELPQLATAGVALGAHGHTHAPLTEVAEPAEELVQSMALLQHLGVEPRSMSFPHGACDSALVAAAQTAGFELIFTSEPTLATPRNGRWPVALGRIHIPENQWTCDANGIAFERLATFLFFRPILGVAQE